ncbi:MAG TPA: hypothetical protein VNE16_08280 [Vicinamibacterales bacterium]|nr:hypothetical protein [Vicinamibacterales bacterium]
MEATRFDPQAMVLDPPHFKKVIYLDQFAISEMVKAIDARSKSHARVKRFWRQVFEALERVCKLQLVVCPWSPIHRDESLVSEMFEPLKRMYEHLGNGVGFLRSTEIELRQINMALVAWLDGKAPPDHDLNPARITTGSLHRWQGRYLVTVSMHHPPEQASGLRQRRTRLNRSLARWFDECRQRTDKSFDHALRIEFEGYRDVLLGAYRDALNRGNELLRQYEAATGEALPSHIENVAPPVGPGGEQVWLILEVLKGRGIAKGEIAKILSDFLDSEHFRKMPIHAISTRLFAVIAHAAANHQRRAPDQGTANDIELVSAYLPYCDAMLIDNRTRAMLENGVPKKYALNYPCRLFSPNVGSGFLAYLKSVEEEADPLILALVRQAYGEKWLKPFVTMFDA